MNDMTSVEQMNKILWGQNYEDASGMFESRSGYIFEDIINSTVKIFFCKYWRLMTNFLGLQTLIEDAVFWHDGLHRFTTKDPFIIVSPKVPIFWNILISKVIFLNWYQV